MSKLFQRRFQDGRRTQRRKFAPERLERRDLLTLLGVVPSHPLLTWDAGGTTTYDATTDQFFSDGTPLTFQETPVSPVRPVVPPRDLKIDIRIDDSGNLIGGAPGDDLIITGSINIDGVGPVDVSGTLLTGEIIAFGYEDVGGTDLYDFRFQVTGGALASYFVGKDIGVTMVSEISTFTGDWTVNFTGGSKGTVGAIDQQTGSLSGVKWQDQTGDGITGDDTPLGGVTIDLYFDANNDGVNNDGGPVASDVTDVGTGAYSFDNLTAGRYFIVEQTPAGMVQTAPSPDLFYTVIVAAGSHQTGFDFANADEGVFEQVGRIAGTKYTDITGDGISGDDTPLGGVTINLYLDANNNDIIDDGPAVATTVTAGDGTYEFLDVDPGNYIVEEVVPAGYMQTAPASGTYVVAVASASDNTGYDFANFKLGKISGKKWKDKTGNGITGDDTPLGGVTIELYLDNNNDSVPDGAAVATTVTATNGTYMFINLGPGRYLVKEVVPAGYTQTAPVSGVYSVLVTSGTNVSGKDFANKQNPQTGSLSGKKVEDLTGNGQSADDVGLGGTTIRLYKDANNDGQLTGADGGPVATTTTAAGSGAYAFTNLAVGRYFVKEVVPSGYIRTGPALTDTYTVIVTADGHVTDLDFANFNKEHCQDAIDHLKNVSYLINGTKTVTDLRGNTNQGDTVKVTFTITAGAEPHQFTLVSYTAPSGVWDASVASQQQIFDMDTGVFGPGTHTLEVLIPNSFYQIDFVCGAAIDQLGPEGSNIFYTPQMRLISADNDGNTALRSNRSNISGVVYVDANNNGVRDAGEVGIGNTKVTLTGSTSSGSVTVVRYTKADGTYIFDNLRSGTYKIVETQPAGFNDGAHTAGSLGGNTSTNDQISNIVVGSNVNGVNYNFGEKPTSVGSGVSAGYQIDPTDSKKSAIVVSGSSGSDVITVKIVNSKYQITVDGTVIANLATKDSSNRAVNRLIIDGKAGNDDIRLDSNITVTAEIYGGEGHDNLVGGTGNNILVGGAGDDTLVGNLLRDLLIAGNGSDTVNGNGGDDLLISGTTAFDNNQTALRAIFAEWNSSRDYMTRINNIKGIGSGTRLNANYFLNDSTVYDDMVIDFVNGGDGRDWLLVNNDGLNQDSLTAVAGNETVTDIDA